MEGKDKDGKIIVSKGNSTSNATIKKWFSESDDSECLQPANLIAAATSETIIKDALYLAFQVPEEGKTACGRTFEDAFLLANPETDYSPISLTGDAIKDEEIAREAAEKKKKSDFAIQFAVQNLDWDVPLYIKKGLEWLLRYPMADKSSEDNSSNGEVVVR